MSFASSVPSFTVPTCNLAFLIIVFQVIFILVNIVTRLGISLGFIIMATLVNYGSSDEDEEQSLVEVRWSIYLSRYHKY